MKKSLCIILSLMMILFTFAACGEKEGEDFEFVTGANGQYVLDDEGNKVTKPIEKDKDGNPITSTTTTTTTAAPDKNKPSGGTASKDPVENLENFNPNASPEDLLDEGTETKKTTLRDDVIIKALKDKKFTMSMTVIGTDTEIPTTITMDGERFGASLSMNGIDFRVLNMNGKSYVAFDYMGMKMYMETEGEDLGMGDLMDSTAKEDQVYVKTTTVKDGNKTYTCEEYKSSDGIVTKYYFEGKKWVRQEVIDGETISISEIGDFKSTVDDSIFDLTGYTKIDEESFASSLGGM
ncbi:MAG: hypothetical protein J6L62_06735 [Clostridia bacterium]|nr:hypothetical protein [Clostridia bacterium]